MNVTYKVLLYVASFFGLLILGDRGISYLLEKNIVDRSNLRYSRLYEGNVDADIILMGNSRGLSFYQPSIEILTGKKTFNMSYNGLPTNLALAIFKDYLQFNRKPKLVIIEATMRGRRKELTVNFACYSSHSKNISDLIFRESRVTSHFNDFLHLSRFNGEVFQRCLYYLREPDTTWLNNAVISKRSLLAKKSTVIPVEFDELAAIDYKAILQICRQSNIPFFLVINPYLPQYRDRVQNFEAVKEKLSETLGETIHDFSRSIQSYEYFADPLHTNKSGSRVFARTLFDHKILDVPESTR